MNNHPSQHVRHPHRVGVTLIALDRLGKGGLLLLAGVGLLRLVHRDLGALVEHWITALGMDPDGQYLQRFVAWVSGITPRHLQAVGFGTLFYGVLSLGEGIGLWLERPWGPVLTVVATASFLPIEVFELIRRFTLVRLGILLFNSVIVAYLIVVMRVERRARRAAQTSEPAISADCSSSEPPKP